MLVIFVIGKRTADKIIPTSMRKTSKATTTADQNPIRLTSSFNANYPVNNWISSLMNVSP